MTDLFRLLQLRAFQQIEYAIRINSDYGTYFIEALNAVLRHDSEPLRSLVNEAKSYKYDNRNPEEKYVNDWYNLEFKNRYLDLYNILIQNHSLQASEIKVKIEEVFETSASEIINQSEFKNDKKNVANSIIALMIDPKPGMKESYEDLAERINNLVAILRVIALIALLGDADNNDVIVNTNNSLAEHPDLLKHIFSAIISLPDEIFPLTQFINPENTDEENNLPQFKSAVQPVGMGDLFVVKRQLIKYETEEVAHIENVLASEFRERQHNKTVTTEEQFLEETERIEEEERDLKTANRFELESESQRTIQEETKLQIGAEVNIKYGPYVEFTGNTNYSSDKARQESVRKASNYSRDITERAVSKVSTRVRTEQIRKIIETIEELNTHRFDNMGTNSQNISGVYQFVNKVYQAEVFKYDQPRLMFDFIIPEPGAFLLYAAKYKTNKKIIQKPTAFTKDGEEDGIPLSPVHINRGNYKEIAARYKAKVSNPPPEFKTIHKNYNYKHEGSNPRSGSHERNTFVFGSSQEDAKAIEINDPESQGYKYAAKKIDWKIAVSRNSLEKRSADSNERGRDEIFLSVMIGNYKIFEASLNQYDETENGNSEYLRDLIPYLQENETDKVLWNGDEHNYKDDIILEPEKQLELIEYSIVGFCTVAIVVNLGMEIQGELIPESFEKWQIDTYNSILTAYKEEQSKYEEEKAQQEFDQQSTFQDFGRNPRTNRLIEKEELKRNAITILSSQHYDHYDSINEAEEIEGLDVPQIDIKESIKEGSSIRFFEQAFEWHNLNFLLYPYYWGRKDTWLEKLTALNEQDPEHLNFLKAGAARVMVPVRPGFEKAISFYLLTGHIWFGGEEPDISSSMYLPIVEEMKDIQREEPDKEQASRTGETWNIKIPTSLVKLRDDDKLPEWKWNSDEEEWIEINRIN